VQRDEFEAIAPGILCIEAALAGKIFVIRDRNSACQKRLPQFVQIGDGERRMCFSRGRETAFDSDVKLLVSAAKPASAPRAQCRRFFDLFHAQKPAVKFPRRSFAAYRSSDLKVVEPRDTPFHSLKSTTAPAYYEELNAIISVRGGDCARARK
jgi:hypothetical protein